jgi:hypothetical protein
MAIDVCGFLEISSLDEADLPQSYAWMSCVDLSSLFLNTGDTCSILFGESKATVSYADVPDEWPPIAKRRGLPPNMASLTAQAVKESYSNDNSLMSTWGYTFIAYEEIERIEWQTYANADLDIEASHGCQGWGLLFSLMKTLDKAGKHQRLIVWFEWR